MNVLSIDGGGIRGIIPARVLVALQGEIKRPLGQVFDLIVGTSTGGLLALAIAAPDGADGAASPSPSALLDLYTSKGPMIFGASGVDFRSNPLMAFVTVIGGPTAGAAPWVKRLRSNLGIDKPSDRGNARYSAAALEESLHTLFGDAKLSDLRTEVVITSYDMATRQPVLFRASDAKADPGADAYLRDVGRATSAAPTFFPPYEMPWRGKRHVLIDGGVVANNPSIIAVFEAFRAATPDESILVLSLGTGSPQRSAASATTLDDLKTRPWPLVAMDLMQTMFDADSQMADQVLTGLAASLPSRIKSLRLQAYLTDVSVAMDDASPTHIRQLSEVGEHLVKENKARITELARQLSA